MTTIAFMRTKVIPLFFLYFIILSILSAYLSTNSWLVWPFIVLCLLAPLSLIWLAHSGEVEASDLLQKGGIVTTAQVVSVKDTGITMNKILIGIELTLQVADANGDTFMHTMETFVSRVQIPRAGDMIEVVYDPQNKSQIALLRD